MIHRLVRFPALLALGFLCAVPSAASATSLSATLTADDTFQMLLSTNDSLAGVPICQDSDNFWPTVMTCSPAPLLPNTTFYLHFIASDIFGPPSMLIGTFGLSDSAFQFSTGTQSLNTNNVNWVVRITGFGDANLTPVDIGPNGSSTMGIPGGHKRERQADLGYGRRLQRMHALLLDDDYTNAALPGPGTRHVPAPRHRRGRGDQAALGEVGVIMGPTRCLTAYLPNCLISSL